MLDWAKHLENKENRYSYVAISAVLAAPKVQMEIAAKYILFLLILMVLSPFPVVRAQDGLLATGAPNKAT